MIVEATFVDEGLVEAMKDFLEEQGTVAGCITCHAELIIYGRRPEQCDHQKEGNT